MKLDTLGLQAFLGVAEHGSFGRAAGALHITQAGLTRRLAIPLLEYLDGAKVTRRVGDRREIV